MRKDSIKKKYIITAVCAIVIVTIVLLGIGSEVVMANNPPVSYENYNYTTKTFETKICPSYGILTGNNNSDITTEISGWYVIDEDVEISGLIRVVGTANLILKDECKLTASKGINVATGSALTIYGQGGINGENAVIGQLICFGTINQAGIGGDNNQTAGSITINGGEVTATSKNGAGIGGGNGRDGGNITINGGKVTATGYDGAGIGGGIDGAGGNITINGG